MSAKWMYPRQTFIERAVAVARGAGVPRENWDNEAFEMFKIAAQRYIKWSDDTSYTGVERTFVRDFLKECEFQAKRLGWPEPELEG